MQYITGSCHGHAVQTGLSHLVVAAWRPLGINPIVAHRPFLGNVTSDSFREQERQCLLLFLPLELAPAIAKPSQLPAFLPSLPLMN